MNARQKAKHYKCEYESQKIDTLQFEQFFPAHIISRVNDDYPRKIVAGRIAQYLADHLEKYIVYRTVYNPRMDEYQFSGSLQVVDNLYNRGGIA